MEFFIATNKGFISFIGQDGKPRFHIDIRCAVSFDSFIKADQVASTLNKSGGKDQKPHFSHYAILSNSIS